MTSEPDGMPRRRPPTIDLTAAEVETEKAGSTPETDAAQRRSDGTAEPQAAGEQTRRRFAHLVSHLRPGAAHYVGTAAGVIAMLMLFAGLRIGGVLPWGGAAQAPAQPSAAMSKDVAARIDKIEAALAAQRSDATLAERMAAVQAETKSLENSLAALNRRLDDVAVTARGAAAAADAARTATQSAAGRTEIEALANRMAALERTVKALSDDVARRPERTDDRAARLAAAAEALRAAVERGAPYGAELAAVKSLGAEDNALAPLQPFAADGVPSAAVLARELAALIPTLRHAVAASTAQGSFLGRLEANAQQLVRITPVDAPSGDDPSAIVARIDVDAARNDIAGALGEIARLPDAARSLVEPWVKQAQRRDTAIAASRSIAVDALAALSKPAAQ